MSTRFIPREDSGEWARFEMKNLGRAAAPAPGAERPVDREAIERAARERGYAAGLQEGRAVLARLAAVLQALDAQVAGFEERYAVHVTDLALEVARQMLRTDVSARRQSLLPVVREALRSLPEGLRRPHLVLHPADVALVRGELGDELTRGHWAIVEDHRIEPGGCRIDSESGDVDATLGTRWKRLAASLGREAPWNAPAPEPEADPSHE